MSNKLILALDQGTTSSRSILFDESGQIVSSRQKEFEQIYPKPGWVEHRPMDIWETQLETAKVVIRKNQKSEIAGIGITNQRETTVVWDRETGIPIYNAIVWQDRRTCNRCLFFGDKTPMDFAESKRCHGESKSRKTCIWHHRHLADLEINGRQTPRYRREQRQPYHDVQHPNTIVG